MNRLLASRTLLAFFLFLRFVLLQCGRGFRRRPIRCASFIRGGVKTHGPNAHEHERFLNDWKVLLNERGMKVDGGDGFSRPPSNSRRRT